MAPSTVGHELAGHVIEPFEALADGQSLQRPWGQSEKSLTSFFDGAKER
ncbi:MAG TPA: hypothetical protein VMU98_06535 [Acidimicrobiales bacterium]|nr:hypothetical protein [Acidimicrobiales bacterium]